MKKLLTILFSLLTFAVASKAQDFTFTKADLEASFTYCGSVSITGDSLTGDVQGFLDANAKDFDAGSIGIFTGSTPTEVAITLSKDVCKISSGWFYQRIYSLCIYNKC